jgi:hypothetical protein
VFEPSAQAIRNWVEQADLDSGRRDDGRTSDERDKLRRLRRENRRLKEEHDILKKAAAWFVRETHSLPGTLTLVSTPTNPSAITSNGTDVDLRFGTRVTINGVTVGTIMCDGTVLSRGTTVCP